MIVNRLNLTNFMSHGNTSITLPDTGVVVVTGANGSGKSSLVEGISVALFGESLRGAQPWRDEQAGEAVLTTDQLFVSRARSKGGRTSLNWSAEGYYVTTYETASKAQAALEERIGTHDVWRRTHIFSSADAAHFTMATDGERKRLLEAILGLEKFDEASDECRAELKTASSNATRLTNELQRIVAQAESESDHLREAQVQLSTFATAADTTLDKQRAADLLAFVREHRSEIQALTKAQQEVTRCNARAEAEHAAAKAAVARFKTGNCPTCGQDAKGSTVRKQYMEQLQHAAGLQPMAQEDYAATIAALTGELQEFSDEHFRLLRNVQVAESQIVARVGAQRIVDLAVGKLASLTEARAEVSAELDVAITHLAELEACNIVLGLRGVRAHVLGRALGGIERATNAWLARLSPGGLKLGLKPYAEKSAGGVTDKIALAVSGTVGGTYASCSGGERRRVDVALLLALADVAGGEGLLVFDEVADSLDEAGVVAVARIFEELGSTRQVIVITHNDELARSVTAAKRLTVTGGRVVER